jgi:hypothetical protein
MKKNQPTERRFVVCVSNDDYPLDLARNRVYEVLADPSAERSGWIRVVDETGEDYLYPARLFRPSEGSQARADKLLRAS